MFAASDYIPLLLNFLEDPALGCLCSIVGSTNLLRLSQKNADEGDNRICPNKLFGKNRVS